MKASVIFSVLALLLAPAAYAIDYSAIPETGKVSKAPVGSTVTIQGTGKFGGEYQNVFRVQPDGSLKFITQYPINTNDN